MGRTNRETIRTGATVFIVGATGTAFAGALVQLVVQPSTNVPDERWSYPWATGPFVVVSLLYIVLHLLIVVGLVSFGRSGVAGTSRAARSGVGLAVAGTLVLAAGEVASLPRRPHRGHQRRRRRCGVRVGVVLSAIGLLLTGKATLSARIWHDWRRYTPLVAGIWTTALVGIAATKALPGGIAVYGTCLLAMAIALYTDPVPAESRGWPRSEGVGQGIGGDTSRGALFE